MKTEETTQKNIPDYGKMIDEVSCFNCQRFPNCRVLKAYGTDSDPDREGLLSAYAKECGEFINREVSANEEI